MLLIIRIVTFYGHQPGLTWNLVFVITNWLNLTPKAASLRHFYRLHPPNCVPSAVFSFQFYVTVWKSCTNGEKYLSWKVPVFKKTLPSLKTREQMCMQVSSHKIHSSQINPFCSASSGFNESWDTNVSISYWIFFAPDLLDCKVNFNTDYFFIFPLCSVIYILETDRGVHIVCNQTLFFSVVSSGF